VGVALAFLALAVEALAVAPGRVALAQHSGALGHSMWEMALGGTLRDVTDVAQPVGGLLFLLLALATFARRTAATDEKVARRMVRTVVLALVPIAFVLWLISAAAAEFKIQRGVDATWFDVEIALRATNPGNTLVGFLRYRRHMVPGLLVHPMLLVLLVQSWRRAASLRVENRAFALGGFLVATVLGWLIALVPLDPNVRVFHEIGDRHIVGEPFVNLFGPTFRDSQENVLMGMRPLIETAAFPAERSTGGEAMVGLPRAPADGAIDCTIHPFARSLSEEGVEQERPRTSGHHALDAQTQGVLSALDRLSSELYEGRSTPVDVWQVMLESFRADDIHGVEPTAPVELAPFMTSLYDSAARGDGSVIAVREMWQGGARSSQGLSSYMCGLGTMPYGLSITRDFGAIPQRCLTDVLVDGQYHGAFWYGGNPSFDGMDPFFRQHGVTHVVGHQQFPPDAPTGQEGVTDRVVYADAAKSVLSLPPEQARYTLVMSASNHVPYNRPDDIPEEVVARADSLQGRPAFVGTPEDAARLRTFAYADFALSELVLHLRARAARSIFVFGADHSTGDPWAWSNATRDVRAATAHIPFTIVLPDPLIDSCKHPEAVRSLVREVGKALDGHPWSQNDVPLLLLTLLSHAPGMKAIPAQRRWHTLGGVRTSPYAKPPHPDAKVWGIDSMAQLFAVNDAQRSLLPDEKVALVRNAAEITTSSPTLMPVAVTMKTFLLGYAARCSAPEPSTHP
jgi:hypothetical protein